MSIRISLCMIVRNEEATLERCLVAARQAFDELCIVDTGSTDNTLAIARRFDARLISVRWTDDFSAARNRSLALATGDWLLVLDADEVLRDGASARAQLESFARERPGYAGRLAIVNHTAEGAADETSTVPITRFFPREGFAFQGQVHEQVVQAGQEPMRAETGCVADHYGYTQAALEVGNKLERNTRLLEQATSRAPRDPYVWYQLGRTYSLAKLHEAALKAYERALDLAPPESPYGPHLLESAGYELRAVGRSRPALDWLSSVESQFRNRADMCFLIALLAMDVGDLERAERGFRHCLTLSGQVPFGGESTASASTYAPNYNLGVMREVLGRLDEAAGFYREALRWKAGHPPSVAALERISH
jgi:hypothetical protein